MSTRIRLRRDTAANWTAVNPVLAAGEAGLESDTYSLKFGNGVTAWNALGYFAGSGGGGGSGVTDPETVRDIVGDALIGTYPVQITPDDTANVIGVAVAEATEADYGIVQVASAEEVIAGLVENRVITPAGVTIALNLLRATIEGVVMHNGTTGGGTRPTGHPRVRWIGGTTRPENMVTGVDSWEHIS